MTLLWNTRGARWRVGRGEQGVDLGWNQYWTWGWGVFPRVRRSGWRAGEQSGERRRRTWAGLEIKQEFEESHHVFAVDFQEVEYLTVVSHHLVVGDVGERQGEAGREVRFGPWGAKRKEGWVAELTRNNKIFRLSRYMGPQKSWRDSWQNSWKTCFRPGCIDNTNPGWPDLLPESTAVSDQKY